MSAVPSSFRKGNSRVYKTDSGVVVRKNGTLGGTRLLRTDTTESPYVFNPFGIPPLLVSDAVEEAQKQAPSRSQAKPTMTKADSITEQSPQLGNRVLGIKGVPVCSKCKQWKRCCCRDTLTRTLVFGEDPFCKGRPATSSLAQLSNTRSARADQSTSRSKGPRLNERACPVDLAVASTRPSIPVALTPADHRRRAFAQSGSLPPARHAMRSSPPTRFRQNPRSPMKRASGNTTKAHHQPTQSFPPQPNSQGSHLGSGPHTHPYDTPYAHPSIPQPYPPGTVPSEAYPPPSTSPGLGFTIHGRNPLSQPNTHHAMPLQRRSFLDPPSENRLSCWTIAQSESILHGLPFQDGEAGLTQAGAHHEPPYPPTAVYPPGESDFAGWGSEDPSSYYGPIEYGSVLESQPFPTGHRVPGTDDVNLAEGDHRDALLRRVPALAPTVEAAHAADAAAISAYYTTLQPQTSRSDHYLTHATSSSFPSTIPPRTAPDARSARTDHVPPHTHANGADGSNSLYHARKRVTAGHSDFAAPPRTAPSSVHRDGNQALRRSEENMRDHFADAGSFSRSGGFPPQYYEEEPHETYPRHAWFRVPINSLSSPNSHYLARLNKFIDRGVPSIPAPPRGRKDMLQQPQSELSISGTGITKPLPPEESTEFRSVFHGIGIPGLQSAPYAHVTSFPDPLVSPLEMKRKDLLHNGVAHGTKMDKKANLSAGGASHYQGTISIPASNSNHPGLHADAVSINTKTRALAYAPHDHDQGSNHGIVGGGHSLGDYEGACVDVERERERSGNGSNGGEDPGQDEDNGSEGIAPDSPTLLESESVRQVGSFFDDDDDDEGGDAGGGVSAFESHRPTSTDSLFQKYKGSKVSDAQDTPSVRNTPTSAASDDDVFLATVAPKKDHSGTSSQGLVSEGSPSEGIGPEAGVAPLRAGDVPSSKASVGSPVVSNAADLPREKLQRAQRYQEQTKSTSSIRKKSVDSNTEDT